MNRGSAAFRGEIEIPLRSFNEAPIHESGKLCVDLPVPPSP